MDFVDLFRKIVSNSNSTTFKVPLNKGPHIFLVLVKTEFCNNGLGLEERAISGLSLSLGILVSVIGPI